MSIVLKQQGGVCRLHGVSVALWHTVFQLFAHPHQSPFIHGQNKSPFHKVHWVVLIPFFIIIASSGSSAVAATLGVDTSTNQKNSQPLLAPATRKAGIDCPLITETAKTEKIVLPTKAQNHDQACLVSVSEAQQLRLKPTVQFVDVRSPVDYQHVHIPESINIPLHLVKTKAFLKKANVMLIDIGRSSVELEAQCVELKKLGFKQVAVLNGGLQAWAAATQPLMGEAVIEARLNRMSPTELFAERLYTGWLVVDISAKGASKELRQWLPANTVAIKQTSIKTQVEGIRAQVLQARKKNPQARVLIVADDDHLYDRLEQPLAKSGVKGSLYLDSGLKGYQDFVFRQTAIWNQQNQPKRFAACRG